MSYFKPILCISVILALLLCGYFAFQQPIHLQVTCITDPNEPLVIQIPQDAELLGQIPEGMVRNGRDLKWSPSDRQNGHYTLELLWGSSWRPSRMTCQICVNEPERPTVPKPTTPVAPATAITPILPIAPVTPSTPAAGSPISKPNIIRNVPSQPRPAAAPAPGNNLEYPQFLTEPLTQIHAGELWSYQPNVKATNGNAKITLKKGPPGMTLDQTGILKWTPNKDDTGQVEVSLYASDDAKLLTFQNFTLSSDLLSKVGAFADWPQTIVPLENGILLGLSQSRLMLIPNDMREVIASYWTPSRGPRTFLYHKGYVFLGEYDKGIGVFDVRDGKSIIPRGKIPVNNRGSHYNAISNDILIIPGEQDYCVYFVSIADPEKPVILSKLLMGVNKNPYSVCTNGTIAYIQGHKYIAAVDFKDPIQPSVLSEVEISMNGNFGAFVCCPPYLYQFGTERVIVDASVPEKLKLVQVSKEHVWGTLAFVTGKQGILYGNGGTYNLDFTDPTPPRVVDSYNGRGYKLGAASSGLYQTLANGHVARLEGGPLPDERADLNGIRYEGVVTSGNLAYVTGNNLDILDISNPGLPRRVGGAILNNGFMDVKPLIYGHILFLGNGCWDVRDPIQPKLIQSWNPVQAFAADASYVYAARGNQIECWKAGDNSVQLLKTWKIVGPIQAMAVKAERLYAGLKTGVLRTYQITPDGLKILNERNTASGTYPYLSDVKLEGEFLYLALHHQGIACYSIHDPDKPEYYSHRESEQYANIIEPRDGIAYVADCSGGVKIVDLRKPGEGKLLASYETTSWTISLALTQNYIVACDRESGIQIFACDLLAKGAEQKPQAEPVPIPLKKEVHMKPSIKSETKHTEEF